MSIYTKTGDKGETSLFDGKRVKKYNLRVETYGVFDECSAQLSVAQKLAKDANIKTHLLFLEEKLFHLNAEIATGEDYQQLRKKSTLIEKVDIELLEKWIDSYQNQLPQLSSFILPGESLAGAELHVARTICRRGERRLIELSEHEMIRPEIIQFVNRLSDCLYTFARVEDKAEKKEKIVTEVINRYHKQNEKRAKHEMTNFSIVSEIINSCVKEAEILKSSVAITIVDSKGLVIASYVMPEAILVSHEVSFKKAYSAISMKSKTEDLQQLTQPGGAFYQLETMMNGKLVTFGGGIPMVDGEKNFIGAIGVSGGTTKEDIQIAETGIQRARELGYAK